MKNCFLIFIMLGLLNSLSAQIVINDADMPEAGDTLRVSLTNVIPGDYKTAGADKTWDFSGLTKISQQVTSYLDIASTPFLYWITFIPGIVSNLASPGNDLQAFPGGPFTDFFTFYKKSTTAFSDVGFAFQISGLPVALKYDSPDVEYVLPCAMGNTWTSHSFASISLPGLAYFSISRSRSSVVDGWGTLTTPFGTFPALRVKSEVIEHDSIYVDTFGIGFPYTRNMTEYKWLGQGEGIPLLQVNEEGMTTTAIYRDYYSSTGINEPEKKSLRVYPNPAGDFCTISMDRKYYPALIQILDIRGSMALEENLPVSAGNLTNIDLSSLPAGLYMVRLISKENIWTGKVMISR